MQAKQCCDGQASATQMDKVRQKADIRAGFGKRKHA